jgi:hypothetical protein
VISSGKPKLQPRESGETEDSIRNMERQNIAEAGKMDAGTSSHRQQPSQMKAFCGQAMLRAEFAENGEEKEPIRSDQSATLFMHVPISSKLAHFLPKNTPNKSIIFTEKKIPAHIARFTSSKIFHAVRARITVYFK